MQQKDYKEIAKIIKNLNMDFVNPKQALVQYLSDYFEREDADTLKITFKRYGGREQFLKDCGVE